MGSEDFKHSQADLGATMHWDQRQMSKMSKNTRQLLALSRRAAWRTPKTPLDSTTGRSAAEEAERRRKQQPMLRQRLTTLGIPGEEAQLTFGKTRSAEF